jgi:hypothetical protein
LIIAFVLCFVVQTILIVSVNPPYISRILYILTNAAFVSTPILFTATTLSIKREFEFPGMDIKFSFPIFVLLIYFPIASFLLSKTNAMCVVYNLQYDCVIINNDETSYKYIGKVGDFLFITSKDNKDLFLRNKSDVHTMEIHPFTVKTLESIPPPPLHPGGR